MLQSVISRVRFCLIALGCAVLSASFFHWAQSRHTGAHQYAWVEADAASAPAVDTAEVWQVSANCVRPYFIRALLRSKAQLEAYYDSAPEAVRARLNRAPNGSQSSGATDWYRLAKSEPGRKLQSNKNADMEYAAQLHVQYAEWYAKLFKLEIEESQWQRRLTDIADHQLSFSESTRKSFGMSAGSNSPLADATNGFDGQVLTMLGLAGFPRDEEQAIQTDCVKISLMKKVIEAPNYFSGLWRWPLEQTAWLALGLELILLGLFLAPMTLWIGNGDGPAAAQRIRAASNGIVAGLRDFDWRKLVSDVAQGLQVAGRTARAVFADHGARSRPVMEERIVHFLRRTVLPAIAPGSKLWQRSLALLRRHALF
jgi:hypothetical protein